LRFGSLKNYQFEIAGNSPKSVISGVCVSAGFAPCGFSVRFNGAAKKVLNALFYAT
jgi:hypothetical protein